MTPRTHSAEPDTVAASAAALVDDDRITLMGLFIEAYTGLTARHGALVSKHGLAPAEFEVLLRLSRSPGGALRMSDLAAQTSLTTSGITRLVDRLERSGLLRRKACPSDRRGLLAEMTDAGWNKLGDVLPAHLDVIEQWLVRVLDKDELDAFQGALRKVRDAVRPCATAGAPGTRSR